jgi:DNA-binding NarL/FixJ family response regulator
MPHAGGVLVGHAHPRLSDGLRHWLQASFEAVYVVGDRASLIEGAQRLQPVLMVLDQALAEGDLAALSAELHRRAPNCRQLLLSDHADAAALYAGVDGVVHMAALATELCAAVDSVVAGRRFVAQAVAPPANPGAGSESGLRRGG